MKNKSKSSIVRLINGVFIEILMLVWGEKKLINGSNEADFGE